MATTRINSASARSIGYGIRTHIASVYVKVYKGTAPADANSYAGSPSTYDSDLLVTFPITTVWNGTSSAIEASTGTFTVAATGTGTATWSAIYSTTDVTKCVITDVSLVGGSAPVTLAGASLSITSGNDVTLADVGIKFTY